MEIYDNGYLTEQEKETFSTQELIHLAASLYANKPVNAILPQHVYKYGFDKDGKIYRWKYTCTVNDCDKTNALWDVYVHVKKYPCFDADKLYYLSAYLDDDGKEIPWNGGKILQYLPIFLAGSDNVEMYRHCTDKEIVLYFLEWKSDHDFMQYVDRIFRGGDAA